MTAPVPGITDPAGLLTDAPHRGYGRRLNTLSKLSLAVLLITVAVGHDLPQLQGKALGLRLVFYPLSALILPIWWRLRAGRFVPARRGRTARGPVHDRPGRQRVQPLRHRHLVGRRQPPRQLGDPHRRRRPDPGGESDNLWLRVVR